jgi:voltage-dependent potassium channel beta subunit
MKYRSMGTSGLKLSELSLGAWVTYGEQVDQSKAEECMGAAYEYGVNFFDNAETYAGGKAELVMGAVIKKFGWRRENLVVSTKIFWGGDGPNDRGLSHKRIIEGLNGALRRLQMDYVDLVYCHRPDPDTPIEETVRAMDIVIKQGKAFYWGTSEWSAADIMRADTIAKQYGLTPPKVEQPQYNMFTRQRIEKEYLPLYKELGFGTTTWSPLASGLLSGKYNDGIPQDSRLAHPKTQWLQEHVLKDDRIAKVKKLAPVAAELGCTLAQLSLAWCLKNPNVSTVITGASRAEQVKENMAALKVVESIDDGVMAKIEEILANKPD